jgi:NAD(P)-dependent dehydrogenase (short-subunit alcohol dehydrogenase family)
MINKESMKVAAISGATGAIGKAIATQLAALDYSVIIIGRDPKKCALTSSEIKTQTNNSSVNFLVADLSEKDSIESLVASWNGPLHILINNAAIAPINRQTTSKGIELQFATNVLGYFWMTQSFADILEESSPSRIINVASYWAGGLDLDDLEFIRRPYHNHAAYRQSKQANRMLTPVFSRLLSNRGITVNSCHPGDVKSTLSSDLGFGGSQTPLDGARTPVWLATASSLTGISGNYYEDQKETSCQFASQTQDADRLYEICSTYQ